MHAVGVINEYLKDSGKSQRSSCKFQLTLSPTNTKGFVNEHNIGKNELSLPRCIKDIWTG